MTLKQSETNPKLRKILGTITSLPTLPESAMRIYDLASKDNVTVTEIIPLIDKDPSISAQLLKIANSPFYGFLGGVSSIDHAVALLGLKEVSNVAFASAVSNQFLHGDQVTKKHLKALWEHSMLTGFVARLLGEEFGETDVATLFLLGLVHDIGSIVLIRFFFEEFQLILEQTKYEKSEITIQEKKVMGITHCEIGALVLKNWRLPARVIFPVLHHHYPWKDKNYPLTSVIIYFADLLVRMSGVYLYSLEEEFEIDRFLNSNGAKMIMESGYELTEINIKRLLQRITSYADSTTTISPL
jgi:HD-like signal output (HDOD) protein